MSQITLRHGDRTWPLEPQNIVVAGRSQDCEIVVTDTQASRHHAQFRRRGSTVVVEDLGSSNGTWVDGARITTPATLADGAAVHIGDRGGTPVTVSITRPTPAVRMPRTGTPSMPLPQRPAASARRPLPRKGAAPAVPPAPSNTGVVFDRWTLPSGPMPTRTPAPSARATVTGSAPQVMPVPLQAPSGGNAGGPFTIGRGLENKIVVDDLLVSRHHVRLVPRSPGFEVHDLGSRNGTYVNGHRIDVAHIGAGDLLAVGHSRFTVRHGQLVASIDEGDVNFVANHLSFALPDGKTLLDDVSFALEGSSLLAVIGPSGAGKSTMLKALTGSQPATEGEVYYDGRDLYDNFQDLRHRIGVVPQEDVVHRQLTVRQALRFAAELRFPDDLDANLRNQRVDEVMAELELTGHAQTRVDRLSGGQRKRTSVALELLTRPSLLFLDEPTSGLDPGLDKQVMQTLRELADGGRTVVVVTHSIANLRTCDKVLLLAPGGKVAYFGPPDEMLGFFGATDHADIFTSVSRDPDGAQHRFRISPMESEQVKGPLSAPRPQAPPLEKPSRQQSIFAQLSTLARRHLRVILADRGYAMFMILLPVVLAILTMVVPGDHGLQMQIGRMRTTEAMQLLVVLIIGAVFMGTAASVRELVGERAIYNREEAVGLSPQAYLWGKLTIFGVLTLLQSVVLVLLVELRKPAATSAVILGSPTLELIVACWLTAFAAVALGLLMSSFVRTSEQVMPLLVVSIMAQLVLCAGLFPVRGRAGLEQIAWLAPARWGYADTASTVDLGTILPSQGGDSLWNHAPSSWILSAAMLVVLTAVFSSITLWRLTRSPKD
ncbi:FHA domain-containing protein [Leekyejoonella antrihumi]|uniref:FHA domain-containing protein n=2 Tax=Leekyejoonella antrihumi TaxID=1660198 RepID=A0A563DZF0_9MICO|nr:FHA domain-containing protein [Leekyejoonella antrihumi]